MVENPPSNPGDPGSIPSRIFIGRTNAKAPVLWLPDGKNWLVGKDLDAGEDWRQEETGTTEDEMVRCRHQPDGHEFEQVQGFGDEQWSWNSAVPGVAKSQTWLSNWTELTQQRVVVDNYNNNDADNKKNNSNNVLVENVVINL